MKTLKSLLVLFAAVAAFAGSSLSAEQLKRVSPHETISTVFEPKAEKNRVTLVYGRPYTRDPNTGETRTIWGGKLVPSGQVWRLGSDEATLLITQKKITLGGAEIPAGAYTLFLQYEESGAAKLIVNKQIGQWGIEYDASQDFVRVDLKKDTAEAPTDQFRMNLTANASGGGGLIKMTWGTTQYSAPIAIAK